MISQSAPARQVRSVHNQPVSPEGCRLSDPRADGPARLLVIRRRAAWRLGRSQRSDSTARLAERSLVPTSRLRVATRREPVERGDARRDAVTLQPATINLRWISPVRGIIASAPTRASSSAPENTRALTGIDPARQRLHGVAQQPLPDHQQRAAAGSTAGR